MAWDAARQRAVLFGGLDDSNFGGNPLAETWEWDGATWSQRFPAHAPGGREVWAMAYDATLQQTVLMGGQSAAGVLQDVWHWDGVDWHDVTPASVPSFSQSMSMVFDRQRAASLIYLGAGSTGMYTWDGVAFTRIGDVIDPFDVGLPDLSFDVARGRAVLFGGMDAGAPSRATLEFDEAWVDRTSAVAPPRRFSHAVTYDARAGRTLVTGGLDHSGTFADTWSYRWEGDYLEEACSSGRDLDEDGAIGCDDPDCWAVCTPTCAPGMACDPSEPRCGDGTCDAVEDCRVCPGDCGACPAVCGDSFCDPGETGATCPGDC